MQLIPEAIAELERCLVIRQACETGVEGHVLRGPTHDALASLYEQIGVCLCFGFFFLHRKIGTGLSQIG